MDGHTFVCYARTDSDFVLTLVSTLKSRGASVWLDRHDIKGGADWNASIDDAIDPAQRAGQHDVVGLVALWSRAVVEIAGKALVDLAARQPRPLARVSLYEIGFEVQRRHTDGVTDDRGGLYCPYQCRAHDADDR